MISAVRSHGHVIAPVFSQRVQCSTPFWSIARGALAVAAPTK